MDDFQELADQLMQMLGANDWLPEDADRAIKSICTIAARRYRWCADRGIPGFDRKLCNPKVGPFNDPHDDRLWFLAWRGICFALACQYPTLLPSAHGLGAFDSRPDRENGGSDRVGVWKGSYDPKRWRNRAMDYASVCRLLHKMATPTPAGGGDGGRGKQKGRSPRANKTKRPKQGQGGRPSIGEKEADQRQSFYNEVLERKRSNGEPMKTVAEDWGISEKEGKAWLQWCRDRQKTRRK